MFSGLYSHHIILLLSDSVKCLVVYIFSTILPLWLVMISMEATLHCQPLPHFTHHKKFYQFENIASFSHPSNNGRSSISFDPFKICLCDNAEIACEKRTGSSFILSRTTLNSSSHFSRTTNESVGSLVTLQSNGTYGTVNPPNQGTSLHCTNLNYTI